MNHTIRKFSILLLAFLLFSSVGFFFSFAEGNKEIENSQKTISNNQQKIKELQNTRSELQSKMEQLNSMKQDTARYIQELDQQQSTLKNEIEVLNGEITNTEQRIQEAQINLEKAEEMLSQQKESMALRIKFIYEADKGGVLETLLQSSNLAELLNNVEYIQQISKADRDKLEDFHELYDEVMERKTALETEKVLLSEQKSSLEQNLADSEQLSKNKTAQIEQFEKQISTANQKVNELNQDVEGLKAAIKAEENKIAAIEAELKRKEEEARRKAKENNKEYKIRSIGELSFQWPVPSSSRVTSTFGDREAPVEGASTSHKGIDIGAEEGCSIKAAESGTVVISTYSQSAGNYVMISHGGGVYTVYMHMSEINVSEDQEVSKGETIGTVGNTGYSTGPHLHFGIRIDGSYDDPLNYVSP